MIELIPSSNYNKDRARIMDGIVEYALKLDQDALPLLRFFRKEENELQRKIKKGPLAAGIDFPKPAKKATSHSGNYVILYTYLPPNAETNTQVTRVNLDAIMPAASGTYNRYLVNMPTFDIEVDES